MYYLLPTYEFKIQLQSETKAIGQELIYEANFVTLL